MEKQKFLIENIKKISDEEIVGGKNVIFGIGGFKPDTTYLLDTLKRNMEMQRRLKKAINISSIVMIVLTFVLVIFTLVLILQGFK